VPTDREGKLLNDSGNPRVNQVLLMIYK